jgi:hypothetical protein
MIATCFDGKVSLFTGVNDGAEIPLAKLLPINWGKIW